jgi:iron complex outermembrane recepter protein
MNKKLTTLLGLLLLSAVFSITTLAQSITGTVSDGSSNPLVGVSVVIQGTTQGAVSDLKGNFTIANVKPGTYTVVASFIGYRTEKQQVTVGGSAATANFKMADDALELESVVVTGSFDPRTKLESSVAITTLSPRAIEQRAAVGTGDLLKIVPGTFVDNSGGEVDARIYPRGLASGSAGTGGQGTGYRYVSLMEDGLPITSTLLNYTSPDILHRADITVSRFEAIRGGSASIAMANSPGGLYNFISREGGSAFGGEARLMFGLWNNSNPIGRVDVNFGGPLKGGWNYNIGGFYRYDRGARDLPWAANDGGQLKFNITKQTEKGKIKFYAKYLNDKNFVFRNLPVDDLTNPKALYGYDLNNGTAITEMKNVLPDGGRIATDKAATRNWDARNGLKVNTMSAGLEFTRNISDNFVMSNNARITSYDTRYNQITAEQLIPTTSFNFLGANTGTIMTAVDNGEELYNLATGVNKLGPLVQLVVPLDMRNKSTDFADQLSFSLKSAKNTLSFGAYLAFARVNVEWDADIAMQSLSPKPRLLYATTVNPFGALSGGVPTRLEFTDKNGWQSIGSIALTRYTALTTTTALFVNDVWEATDKLSIDAALRYEIVGQNGEKQFWSIPALGRLPLPASAALVNQIGADGQYGTRYDATLRIANGNSSKFNFRNDYVSYSLGFNYKLADNMAVYARYTNGNKAPDTDFYVNNFVNVPVENGVIENIKMGELGYKLNSKNVALGITAFYSQLDNLPFTQLISNTVTGESFYSPPTFNTSETKGIELEANLRANKIFSLAIIGTLQDAKFTKFSFYNVNGFQHPVFIGQTYPATNPSTGTPYVFADNRLSPSFPQGTPNAPIAAGTPSYHTIEDLSGKKVDGLPSFMLDITPAFDFGKFNFFANYRFTGERSYNKQNAFMLPSFSTINLGASYDFGKFDAAFRVTNLTNEAALIQNDGLGRPNAAGIDAIKPADIQAQKTAGFPFWGRPMLARQMTLTLTYRF